MNLTLETWAETVGGLTDTVQLLFGGIVGIYILLILLRWWAIKKQQEELNIIKADLNAIKTKLGVKTTQQPSKIKKITRRIGEKIKEMEGDKHG